MSRQIFRSIFFTSLILVLAVMLTLITALYHYYAQEQLETLEATSAYVSDGIESEGEGYLSSLDGPYRVTLLSTDGTVVFDTAQRESYENHLDRKEIREALSTGSGSSVRHSKTLNEDTVYFATTLEDGRILRLSTERLSIFQILFSLLQIICLTLAIVCFCSYLLSTSLARKILKPLGTISLREPLKTKVYSELTPLLERIEEQNERIERQMAEAVKMQSDFKAITDNMSEGMIITDDKGTIISSNHATAELLEIEEVSPGINALSLNEQTEFKDPINRALKGGKGVGQIKVGERIHSIIATPVFSDKVQTGTVTILIDVTERELREKLRSEYIANISHELKTPLTSISGFAEIIKSGIADPKDTPHFIDNIYNESNRLINLLKDLLTLGRLDEGVLDLTESVDLRECVNEAVGRLKDSAAQKGITIKTKFGAGTVLEGDKNALDEMVFNLLSNAVKYNKVNGVVYITVGKENGKIVLTVRDTGIGIANGEKERIFERFYRVDKSRSKAVDGTGLGLAIVKHAALCHNASVSVESQPGVGTSFKVVFNVGADARDGNAL